MGATICASVHFKNSAGLIEGHQVSSSPDGASVKGPVLKYARACRVEYCSVQLCSNFSPSPLDAHANGPGVCSFFGPTNLVRSGVSPLGILALDTLQRGRRLAERGPGDSPL